MALWCGSKQVQSIGLHLQLVGFFLYEKQVVASICWLEGPRALGDKNLRRVYPLLALQ